MDPCTFWKTFCDPAQPNPVDDAPEESLEALMAHCESCTACTGLMLPLLERLADAVLDAERPTEGPSAELNERAAQLLLLVLLYLPSPEDEK